MPPIHPPLTTPPPPPPSRSPSHSLTLEPPSAQREHESSSSALSETGLSSDEEEEEGSTAGESRKNTNKREGKGMHRRTSSTHRVRETLNAKSVSLDDGKRTVNQYRLGPEIGKGAFGRVELGVDVQTGIRYAVKEYSKSRLRRQVRQRSIADARKRPSQGGKPVPVPAVAVGAKDVTSSSEGKDRNRVEDGNPLALIAREVAIMKKLDHPNLIHLYEVLDVPDEDSLFMVLEYCSGGILMELPPLHPPSVPSPSSLLSEEQKRKPSYIPPSPSDASSFPTPIRPPMTLLSAKLYFSQILMGLEYLHENSVVHLDLKPENILLGADGKTAKLCDFGVSEMFKGRGDDRVRKGMGSPAFQSPESLGEGREIHAKAADVWALGITLYCMRSGFLPFRYDNPLDLFEAIKHEKILFPPHFTGEGKDIIERLLERDPHKRITIDEIRVHPWLSDIEMPSKEENLAEERMVVEPTPSEINDAIRSISSAFAVIRAVQKFKKLGRQHSAKRASSTSTTTSSMYSPSSSHRHLPHEPSQPSRQSTFESAVSMTSESPPNTRFSTPSSSFSNHQGDGAGLMREAGGGQGEEEKKDGGGQIGEEVSEEPEEMDESAVEISEEPQELSEEPLEYSEEPVEISEEPVEMSDEPESIPETDEDPSTPITKQPPSYSHTPSHTDTQSSSVPPPTSRPTLSPSSSSFSRPPPRPESAFRRQASSSSSSSSISSRPKLNVKVSSPSPPPSNEVASPLDVGEEGEDGKALGAELLLSRFGMIVVESPGGGRSEVG